MTALTIGMPLYNNARTLDRAIGSLLDQTFRDLTIVASDDGSRDDTRTLLRRWAERDPRVSVVEQPRNLNYGNFRFVLQAARTPYFMFAAGDDWWEPAFAERCIEALEANPTAVCAVSRVLMHPADAAPSFSLGTQPLMGSVAENVRRYLDDPNDNSRMYGVYRTAAAQASFPASDHFAFDWTFCAATLAFGGYAEVADTLMHREVTPSARYIEYVRRDNPAALDRLFPLLPMTRALLRSGRLRLTPTVLVALTRLNREQHLAYMRRYHPRIVPALDRVYRLAGVPLRVRARIARVIADRASPAR